MLEAAGVDEPLWYEVPKAKQAPEQVRRALDEGAELVFAWGGDGTVRRCIDVLAGTDGAPRGPPGRHGEPVRDQPRDPRGHRARRRRRARAATAGSLDVGRFGKERFAVMAGAGFDAAMIRDADDLKERVGRAAYLWSGSRNLRAAGFGAEIEVDGTDWYEGRATCVLLGNLGDIFGGVDVFPDARPDDGMLELGIVTAEGLVQWARTLARTAVGDPNRSPFVRTTKAKTVKVQLDRKVRYELDGGDRSKVKSFEVKVEAGALSVCVPRRDQEES